MLKKNINNTKKKYEKGSKKYKKITFTGEY